jgi:predicted S18 family serine protease
MAKKRKSSDLAIIALAFFLLGAVVGILIMANVKMPSSTLFPSEVTLAEPGSGSEIIMNVPAVDINGKGVLGQLVTKVMSGSGQVLVDVKNVITLGDTQQSAQNAVKAAAAYTKKDLSSTDVIFNMRVNATSIEGPSAGSSMAVAIVFGLLNETPRPDVMMTGTIDASGDIGKVGAIYEKARVAKEAGATVFVVPKDQSSEKQTTRTRQCRQAGATTICKIVYESMPTDIGKLLNMTVVEASSLEDAIKYFRK